MLASWEVGQIKGCTCACDVRSFSTRHGDDVSVAERIASGGRRWMLDVLESGGGVEASSACFASSSFAALTLLLDTDQIIPAFYGFDLQGKLAID